MFGLSLSHLILFGIIALIFIGPEQLPEVARTIGRLLNELRRATSDFQGQFTGQFRDESEELRELRRQLSVQQHAPPPAPPAPLVTETPADPNAVAAEAPPLIVAPGPYEGRNTDDYHVGVPAPVEPPPVVDPAAPPVSEPEKKS